MKKSLILFISLCFWYNSVAQNTIDYETQIQPIFNNSCMPCHGPTTPSAGLNLSSYEGVMAGSDDGLVINIGDYENSILWQEVSSGDMPNNTANNIMGISDLAEEEVELIANWILDLQCAVIDCASEYTCLLGECVCINDADGDGICDEFETSIDELKSKKEIIKEFNLLGSQIHPNSTENIKIYLYDDGSIEKVKEIK